MPADESTIRVVGVEALARACDKINRDMRPIMAEAADEISRKVVSFARGAARTPQQRLAAATLQARGSGTLGSDWAGFAGSEFGGGARPETKQFPPHRGKRGYFLYPSMRANAPSLNRIWSDALDDAMKPWNYKPPTNGA